MGKVFFKSLKWFFFIAFIIFGIWAFQQVEEQGVEYAMLIVFSLGGAYLMSNPWRALSPKPMVYSIILVAALALLAANFPRDLVYIYTGIDYTLNFYISWTALTFVLGLPAMMFIFSKYDD